MSEASTRTVQELESLLAKLQERLERKPGGDAIDAILRATPRTTAVRSLRDHEAVRKFREEIAGGLVRVDTAGQLVSLVRALVEAALE
jgi:hypothetical protein